MVQGGNKKSNKKPKKEAPKKKQAPKEHNETGGKDEISKTLFKKVKQHQKKIYKSIEDTIIENAKKSRERFDIL